ncbi:MAG: PASTA domain-containing protein [Cyclobacteriaceae bacterium]|nr:PASTA domain-containing protein [Cyclobacteriaceae bacterium]
MAKKHSLFKTKSIRGLLVNIAIVLSIFFVLAIIYFYIHLPSVTNHGESITVPDLSGMNVEELESFLSTHELRFAVNDSAYSSEFPPLTVLQQYPKSGSKVKENRVIYVSLNRVKPPTLPMPDLIDGSLVNAQVILKSVELTIGRILYEPSPFKNVVKEMRFQGKSISPGTRIEKGAVIDLIVGDGNGPADFVIGNLIGDSFERAKFKIGGWDLHLGTIQFPVGIDTTGMEKFVYKQYPMAGDSVRVGDPVDLWIGPKGYKEPDDSEPDSE